MKTYDSNNIFAKILRGEIPNDTVYENDYVLAFRDIAPKAPVHVLVIPKNPYISMQDFGENASNGEKAAMFRAISDIAGQEGIAEDGYRCIANTDEHGGQEVPHFHMHILGGEKLGKMI